MPKVATGGKPFTHNPNPFKEWDSNTICDVTGFRVKVSEVVRRWEGYYVIPAAWHQRQPQDFPVVPVKQRIYPTARVDQILPDVGTGGAFSDGFDSGFDIGGIGEFII